MDKENKKSGFKNYLIMVIIIAIIWICATIFLFTKDVLVAVVTLVCFVLYAVFAGITLAKMAKNKQ